MKMVDALQCGHAPHKSLAGAYRFRCSADLWNEENFFLRQHAISVQSWLSCPLIRIKFSLAPSTLFCCCFWCICDFFFVGFLFYFCRLLMLSGINSGGLLIFCCLSIIQLLTYDLTYGTRKNSIARTSSVNVRCTIKVGAIDFVRLYSKNYESMLFLILFCGVCRAAWDKITFFFVLCQRSFSSISSMAWRRFHTNTHTRFDFRMILIFVYWRECSSCSRDYIQLHNHHVESNELTPISIRHMKCKLKIIRNWHTATLSSLSSLT